MTSLPEFFKQTSDLPYDRHNYKLVFTNNQWEVYDAWELVQARWFQVPPQFKSHIEILDKGKKKKGFN